MTLFPLLFSISAFAAAPAFLPAAQAPDHCEAAVRSLVGSWAECRVEELESHATEAHPALQRAELEAALAAKPVALTVKQNAEVKVAGKTWVHETAVLSLPAIFTAEVAWFGKDNFAAPKNPQTKAKGFHLDYSLKDLACTADNSAYRFQGVEKKDGSRRYVSLYRGSKEGAPGPLLYVSGSVHDGHTKFAIFCSRRAN